ncbi:MAG: hypothetical protein WDO17_11350 [Alphaproteobacteria bacterium]
MRAFLAALALAGALSPSVPPGAAEPAARLAQMSRDVTDAVRRQRAQTGREAETSCRCPANRNQK